MKRLMLLCLAMACLSGACYAQSANDAYNAWIEKAQEATGKGLQLEAAWAYNRAFSSGPGGDDPWTDRYHAAIAWAGAGRPDSAIAQLQYLARHTGYGDYAAVDLEPAFMPMHGGGAWKPLLAQIRKNRYVSDPASDTALADRLANILVLDQRFRTQLEAFPYGSTSPSADARRVADSVHHYDAIHVAFIDSLLSASGWVGPKRIGRRGVGTVFIVLQHADSAVQAKYQTMLRDANNAGDLPSDDLALFEDRLALRQGREQIYGTQVVCVDGKCRVDRLADPLHVDEHRKSVGLGPLAEYLDFWDIEWDAVAYERDRNAAGRR